MFEYPLEQLTEFNPALIYSFSPESSSKRMQGSIDIRDLIFPEVAQYGDMFRAYYYAQTEILPFIREHSLAALTPGKLIEWIKHIHKEIAKNLLQTDELSSGVYSQDQVLRTHSGWESSDLLLTYLSQRSFAEIDQPFIDSCISHVQKAYVIDKKELNDFIHLLLKANSFPIDILFPSQLLTKWSLEIHVVLAKFSAAYTKNIFNPSEKAIIDKLVKICLPPELIEEHMRAFAIKTVQNWQACQNDNLDEVVELISETFFSLTEIHPFPNGNGRMATCLINIMLRSLEWPSILVRHPGEKNKMDSTYSIAIAQIDQTRAPLKEHIKQRIIEAKTAPYEHVILKQYVEKRIQFAELCQEIFTQHPHFDLNKTAYAVGLQVASQFPPLVSYDDYVSLNLHLELSLIEMTKIKKSLDAEKTLRFSHFKPHSPPAQSQAAICDALATLSGVSTWKGYRQGKIFLFESSDPEEIKIVLEKLRAYSSIMCIDKLRNKTTKNPVIQCTGINITMLIDLASKQTISPALESSSSSSNSFI